MNRANKLMRVAVAITAVFNAAEAFAQGFTPAYATKDLLLSFRQQPIPGAAGATDVTFDLGNVSTFLSSYGNQSVQINSGAFSRPNAFDASLLTSAGGGNYGNLNNLHFGVTAAEAAFGINDMWATAMRGSSTDNTVSDSTAWTRKSATSQGSAAGKIRDVGAQAQLFGSTLSTTAIKSGDGTPQGYNTISSGGVFASYFSGSTEGFTGAAFGANDTVRLDFYAVNHTASGTAAAGYLGFFELQGDGDLLWIGKDFASAVVPEPTTYGLLAGLGMLALTTRRQLRQLRQA